MLLLTSVSKSVVSRVRAVGSTRAGASSRSPANAVWRGKSTFSTAVQLERIAFVDRDYLSLFCCHSRR